MKREAPTPCQESAPTLETPKPLLQSPAQEREETTIESERQNPQVKRLRLTLGQWKLLLALFALISTTGTIAAGTVAAFSQPWATGIAAATAVMGVFLATAGLMIAWLSRDRDR